MVSHCYLPPCLICQLLQGRHASDDNFGNTRSWIEEKDGIDPLRNRCFLRGCSLWRRHLSRERLFKRQQEAVAVPLQPHSTCTVELIVKVRNVAGIAGSLKGGRHCPFESTRCSSNFANLGVMELWCHTWRWGEVVEGSSAHIFWSIAFWLPCHSTVDRGHLNCEKAGDVDTPLNARSHGSSNNAHLACHWMRRSVGRSAGTEIFWSLKPHARLVCTSFYAEAFRSRDHGVSFLHRL